MLDKAVQKLSKSWPEWSNIDGRFIINVFFGIQFEYSARAPSRVTRQASVSPIPDPETYVMMLAGLLLATVFWKAYSQRFAAA